jgi:hypothetical protein
MTIATGNATVSICSSTGGLRLYVVFLAAFYVYPEGGNTWAQT